VIAVPFRWIYDHVLAHLGHGFVDTFGSAWPFVAVGLAVLAGVLAGTLLIRRRSRPSNEIGGGAEEVRRRESARDLEREAGDAESAGDYETAVRLLFRAGLARLEDAGAIDDRLAVSDLRLRNVLVSETFDRLADRHELILYAEEPASADDAREARQGWPVVVSSAPRGGSPE
jgi:hypothetical protein